MFILVKEVKSDKKHAREATRQPMNNTSAINDKTRLIKVMILILKVIK